MSPVICDWLHMLILWLLPSMNMRHTHTYTQHADNIIIYNKKPTTHQNIQKAHNTYVHTLYTQQQ